MLTLTIPGKDPLALRHLILDFNGTIANGGILLPGVGDRIRLLSKDVEVHVITADTNGSVVEQCSGLPVSVHVLKSDDHMSEKGVFVRGLGGTISIGNGANDAAMFEASDVAIAVVGAEGCATSTLLKSDIAVHNINDALDLFLHPNRIIATLRK